MSRRSDPERIAAAWEAGTCAWLGGLGLLPARVDELMAAWAAAAEGLGLKRLERAYWDQARPWLEERAR